MKLFRFHKSVKPAAIAASLLCIGIGLAALFSRWTGGDDDESPTAVPTTTEGRAIRAHDADHDGKLSKSEKREMETKFVDAFDKDGDGTLNPTERQTVRSTARVNVQPSVAIPKNLKDAAAFLAKMDQDGDGTVTESEASEKRWAALGKADKNANGRVTAEEWLDYKSAGDD